MINELLVILLVILFGASFTWAFRTLPQEKWQVIAAVPQAKETDSLWRGLNLTY
jgi:protein-S-isoprenylcysteine O-methyltransferase Ste14